MRRLHGAKTLEDVQGGLQNASKAMSTHTPKRADPGGNAEFDMFRERVCGGIRGQARSHGPRGGRAGGASRARAIHEGSMAGALAPCNMPRSHPAARARRGGWRGKVRSVCRVVRMVGSSAHPPPTSTDRCTRTDAMALWAQAKRGDTSADAATQDARHQKWNRGPPHADWTGPAECRSLAAQSLKRVVGPESMLHPVGMESRRACCRNSSRSTHAIMAIFQFGFGFGAQTRESLPMA